MTPVICAAADSPPAHISAMLAPTTSAAFGRRSGEVISTCCDEETRSGTASDGRLLFITASRIGTALDCAPTRNGRAPVGRKVALTCRASSRSSRTGRRVAPPRAKLLKEVTLMPPSRHWHSLLALAAVTAKSRTGLDGRFMRIGTLTFVLLCSGCFTYTRLATPTPARGSEVLATVSVPLEVRIGQITVHDVTLAQGRVAYVDPDSLVLTGTRSEERRVGKECRSRWS